MAANTKLSIRLSDDISLTLENTNVKGAIAAIEEFATYFGNSECGACQGTDMQYIHRHVQDYDFYEIRCRGCGSKLEFGETKVGNKLFPKRKDKEGNYLVDGGWTKYQPQGQQGATAQAGGGDPF